MFWSILGRYLRFTAESQSSRAELCISQQSYSFCVVHARWATPTEPGRGGLEEPEWRPAWKGYFLSCSSSARFLSHLVFLLTIVWILALVWPLVGEKIIYERVWLIKQCNAKKKKEKKKEHWVKMADCFTWTEETAREKRSPEEPRWVTGAALACVPTPITKVALTHKAGERLSARPPLPCLLGRPRTQNGRARAPASPSEMDIKASMCLRSRSWSATDIGDKIHVCCASGSDLW